MATININGRRITVEDRFLELSPDEQNAAVDEIAHSMSQDPGPSDGAASTAWDAVKSGAAGAARGALDLVGLPGTIGDAMQSGGEWAMRKGYELATGEPPSTDGGFVERIFAGPSEDTRKVMPFGGRSPLSGEVLKEGAASITDGATDYQPKTTAGEYARTIGEFAPSAAAFGGLRSAGTLAGNLIAPAVASETAGQLTQDTWAEPIARVGGALVGGAAGSKIGAPAGQRLPTSAEIKAAAGFDDLKPAMQNATIDKNAYRAVIDQLKTVADDFGMVPEQHGAFNTILARHLKASAKNGASLQDLEILRRSLQNAGASPTNPSAGALSRRLTDTLDEALGGLENSIATAGGQNAGETLDGLRQAREAWRTGSKAQIVETAIEKARLDAGGFEAGLRNRFRTMLQNPKIARQFSDAERAAMEDVVLGGFKANAARFLGTFGVPVDQARNWLGASAGAHAGSSVGGALGGPAGAFIGGITVPVVGTAFKAMSAQTTRNGAALAEALVKGGPRASQQYTDAMRAGQVAGRQAWLRTVQQARQGGQNGNEDDIVNAIMRAK
ncbi:hypothetical protein DXT96_08950 [Agrobacterium sp. ICMP 6402]|uniref:hypothetical protein n=1 Tax=Agrobacterium sp. ICMP 6402 TaxID=2292443 RepID=UPI0012956FCF|nr:hypothetical protein [Agrobacterium sp. ICMP 6402]MQB09978.1 hypothetical protein [Agrobacterium sp. ICMP 6402]